MGNSSERKLEAFARILNIMDDLRSQCPWDKKQTMDTLRLLTIEETYELADAIIDGDMAGVEEEIGDLLLHVVFYAKIGEERGEFDIESVINRLCDKLIDRHPHIYGDVIASTEQEVKNNWEKIKMKTSGRKLLSGVPKSLPSVVKAYRLQDKTAQVGFEWEDKSQVWHKVKEEITEMQEAEQNNNHAKTEEEFGDVLFALVNYARFIGVDPEAALERTNKKFIRRFNFIEEAAVKPLEDMTLDEMDKLWNEAKMNEKA